MTRRSAAIAALTILAMAMPAANAAHAAPARSKASLTKSRTSAAAKRKAATVKAASEEAARRDAQAKAAEAAEKARVRAQWGLVADLGEGDFQTPEGLPVTVRRSGDTVEVTSWSSIARGVIRFERDPASGTMTLSTPGQWSRKSFPARVMPDGTIEATSKNEARWTVLSRDPEGGYALAGMPGGKFKFDRLEPGSKASDKLAKLISAGKVAPAGASANGSAPAWGSSSVSAMASSPAIGIPSMATLQAAEGLDFFRKLDGDWWNGTVKWSFTASSGAVQLSAMAAGSEPANRKIEFRQDRLLFDGSQAVPIAGGIFIPKRSYAIIRDDSDGFSVTAGKLKDGRFIASNGQGMPYLGQYRRMTPAMAEQMRLQFEAYRVAQAELAARKAREKQSGGGGGMFGRMLGGALMGAMLGGGGQSSLDLAMAGAQAAAGGGNTLDTLNAMGSVASAQAAESKRELDATIARAEEQAEADRRRKRQEEAEENARRVAAANARQQAIADQYAAQHAATDAQKDQQLALAEQQRLTRAKASQAEQERRDAQAKADAAAEQQRRDARVQAEAEARRNAEAQKLAEQQRRDEEARRPVAFKEGVVVCQQQGSRDYWRCDGPLQVTYAVFGQSSWRTNIGQACGGGTINDFGMVSGYRAFGGGFGIHPSTSMRDYPGNRDVPATMGLYIPDRGTFYCPKTVSAYCRGG
jgi:hypothetical protein